MTKTLTVTDDQLGQWLDVKDYPSFEAVLVEIVRLSQRYGFELYEEIFESHLPRILADDMDEEMETAFMFLVRDAVDYLNGFIIPDGYRFIVSDGLVLTKWMEE